jgi:hypothetical protein
MLGQPTQASRQILSGQAQQAILTASLDQESGFEILLRHEV